MCYNVFISHRLHPRYIKIALRKYVSNRRYTFLLYALKSSEIGQFAPVKTGLFHAGNIQYFRQHDVQSRISIHVFRLSLRELSPAKMSTYCLLLLRTPQLPPDGVNDQQIPHCQRSGESIWCFYIFR